MIYVYSETVLGDRDLLVIFAIFTIVMYGKSNGSSTKNPCRQVPSLMNHPAKLQQTL